MKRLTAWIMVLGFLLFAVVARAADEDMQEKRKRLEAAKNELNNLEWKIKMNPIGQTRAKAYEDTLVFTNPSRISSKKLESKGFPASNYTVSIKRDDVIVWETMQTSEDAGLAFWRGELKNDVMRGVLSRHPKKKAHMDFSFYSIEKKEIKPEPAKPKGVKQEIAERIKEEPKKIEKETEQKPAPKRKKRGWWWR